MANGPLTVETRRRLYEEDSQWPLKAILRIIATASALLATILLAASVSLTNSNFVTHDGRKANDWMDGMALAPVRLLPASPCAHIRPKSKNANIYCQPL